MQQKDLALALGISPAMVSKLAKRGMPTDSLERAQRWRRRHLELARGKSARLSAAQAPARQGVDADEGEEADAEDVTSADYRLARAEREQIRAQRERIELQKLQGQLVDVQEAARLEFTAMRALRDRLQLTGVRVAPRLAQLAASGASIEDLQRAVDEEVDEGLRSAVTFIEQLKLEQDEDQGDIDG